ncbi:MAG TPA: hypothetical protein DCM38_06785 [Gammaproteobacteria bacterium]|nr:hypothetical protein [Gammaproteobacteria bacterium]
MNTNILNLLEEQINVSLGITLPHFINDGRTHYFSDPDHHNPKNTAGHYKIYKDGMIDGFAIAYVGSYWTGGSRLNDGNGDRQFYQIEGNNQGRKINLDEAQIRYLKEKDEERKREILLKRKSVANLAKEVIGGAELILKDDPLLYLIDKKIPPIGLYKTKTWDNKDIILVPLQNVKGEIQGYQKIFENGSKKNQTGFGPNGSFFLIGTIDPKKPHKIYVCEGVATGISIFVATQTTTCPALNTSNLKATVLAIKGEYPNHEVIGLGDHDDQWKEGKVPSHAGYKAMTEAMNAINSYFKLPSFDSLVSSAFLDDSEQVVKYPTDFNDLFRLAGPEEVRRQIAENSPIPLPNNFKSQPVIPTSELSGHFLAQFDTFFAALEDPSANPSFMLKAPAASGKTSMFMRSLARVCETSPRIRGAAYFPTHALAKQETENARNLGIDAIQIFGRSEPGYCKKNDAIKLYHSLGGSGNTFETFCDDGEGSQCEHKTNCLYLNQFKSPRQLSCFTHAHLIQYPNGLEDDLYEGKRPHFIFVDETYTQGCEKNSLCPRAFFNENTKIPSDLKEIILDSLDNNKPMLKALRVSQIDDLIKEEGEKAVIQMIERFNGAPFSGELHKDNPCLKKWITHKAVSQIDDLIKEEGKKEVIYKIECFNGVPFSGELYSENPSVIRWANHKAAARIDAVLKELKSAYPSFNDITPSMKLEAAMCRLEKKERGINIRAPLRQIKLELEKTTRAGLTGVHMYTKRDGNAIISTHYVQPVSRHKRPIPYSQDQFQLEDSDYVPLIISDAHLNEDIVIKSLDLPFDLPLVQVNAEPNLEVIQVSSTELSGKSLALKGDQYMADVAKICEAEKPGRCLIIGPQKLVGNEKNGIPEHPTIKKLKDRGAQTIHWKGLRGIDRFKDTPVVITIGRLQPPTTAIENQARCWYSEDNVPLNFNTEKLPSQYNMRDGTQRFAETFHMSDPRLRDFLYSHREAEIIQGVFRTRPIHGEKKKAYILTSIPTELKVDRLVDLRELRGNRAPQYIIPKLFKRFFDPKTNAPLVMPMGPSVLFPLVKDLFNSEEVLKNWVSRNGEDMKRFIADETGTTTEEISYRLGGSRGRSRRAVVLLSDESLIRSALSEMHPGREIVIEGVATDVGIVPSLLKAFWDSTLEVGREVLEKVLEVTGDVNLVFNNIVEKLSQDALNDLNDLSAWDVWEAIKKLGPMEYG